MLNRLLALPFALPARTTGRAIAQDVIRLHVRQLTVLAEDADARVLRYAPHVGERVPMHSHPRSVGYVLKGGRVRYTFPDGCTRDARESILIEMKR